MNISPGPWPESRFRRILFCTDFSESADAAFDYAVDATVRRPGATLHLLHVIHEPDAQFWKSYLSEVDDIDAAARKAIDQKVAAYRSRLPSGVDFKVDFRVGPEAASILEFAAANQMDLIVLGRQGRRGIGHALFGSVAAQVVRKAGCAVLVVPLVQAREGG